MYCVGSIYNFYTLFSDKKEIRIVTFIMHVIEHGIVLWDPNII